MSSDRPPQPASGQRTSYRPSQTPGHGSTQTGAFEQRSSSRPSQMPVSGNPQTGPSAQRTSSRPPQMSPSSNTQSWGPVQRTSYRPPQMPAYGSTQSADPVERRPDVCTQRLVRHLCGHTRNLDFIKCAEHMKSDKNLRCANPRYPPAQVSFHSC